MHSTCRDPPPDCHSLTVFPIGGSFPIRPRDGHCVWFFSHTIHIICTLLFLSWVVFSHSPKLNATFIFSCILFLGLIWRLDFPCFLRIINAPLVFYDLNFFFLFCLSLSHLSLALVLYIFAFISSHFRSFHFVSFSKERNHFYLYHQDWLVLSGHLAAATWRIYCTWDTFKRLHLRHS